MIRAVLDTNVLASGLLSTGGTPSLLLALWEARRYDLIISPPILDELELTLLKPYFQGHYRFGQVERGIRQLRSHALLTAITVDVQGIAAHVEDDLVIATAISASAGILVTGDHRLRAVDSYCGVSIRTPREFLTFLEAGSEINP
jgi:uncharacterized protein